MIALRANVTFFTQSQGGLAPQYVEPVTPSINLKGKLTSARIFRAGNESIFELGKEYLAFIELPLGEYYEESLEVGYEFKLQAASRVIGQGRILDIIRKNNTTSEEYY
ncbi:hypothetical protein EOI86_18650 [Hwanghaeella grinnelliae]|uniref:Translation elongation factor EFTu/EF1A C-terminal domain-containing protein n=1 Tax=Hwanghaeella grinnelliae TaxID=2500179 RepID=A0A437QK23_9PROT|nr:hypothetical protein [Hwanghaeella grinnelliae]RVU34861.1 hypothetical protein EOI86_18650 [Hwanghaeella grinnelliae]